MVEKIIVLTLCSIWEVNLKIKIRCSQNFKGIIEIVDFVLQFSITEILRETTYFTTMPTQ